MTDQTDPNAAGGTAAGMDEETLELAHRLFDAARNGETEMLRSYLNAGAPATLTNSAGDSLLMLAAYHGHAETVQLVLYHGGDVNQANGRGQTPSGGRGLQGLHGRCPGAARRRRRSRRRNPLGARRRRDVRPPGHPGPAGLSPWKTSAGRGLPSGRWSSASS